MAQGAVGEKKSRFINSCLCGGGGGGGRSSVREKKVEEEEPMENAGTDTTDTITSHKTRRTETAAKNSTRKTSEASQVSAACRQAVHNFDNKTKSSNYHKLLAFPI